MPDFAQHENSFQVLSPLHTGNHEAPSFSMWEVRQIKQKDDLVTIWNVAKKHNAGIEMVKRWYQWNGVKVDEDYLQQCIDLIEKYNVQSLDQFAELMSRQ